jgi:hypothetical protein
MTYNSRARLKPVQIPTPRVHQQSLPVLDWTSRIADVIRNHFSLRPKDHTYMYRHPYLESFDRVSLPNRYRMLNFSKFSSQYNMEPIEQPILGTVWRGSCGGCFKSLAFPSILVRISFHMVRIFTCQLYSQLGRFGETIRQIFLHWPP